MTVEEANGIVNLRLGLVSAKMNIAKAAIQFASGRKYRLRRKGFLNVAWQLVDEYKVPILSVDMRSHAVTIESNDLAKPELLTLIILGEYLALRATQESSD